MVLRTWAARSWTAIRRAMAAVNAKSKTKVDMTIRYIVGVICVIFLITWGVYRKIELNDTHDRQRDAAEQIRYTFASDLRSYDIALTQFTNCLNSVDSRNALREALLNQNRLVKDFTTIIDNYVPEQGDQLIADLYERVTANADQINTDYAAYPADHCPSAPPSPPKPPDALTPQGDSP